MNPETTVTIEQASQEPFIVITRPDGSVQRMTVQQAHAFLDDNADHAVNNCVYCAVSDALEGIR